MINKLRVRAQSESGFTLVELLVVMLIIGLLAAIAIPAFFNQRDKAKDSDAKEAVRTAQTAIETFATDHNGTYAGADNAALAAIEETLVNVTAAPARLTTTVTATGDGYTVTVAAEDTGNTFSISRADSGALTYPCTVGGEGGCPDGGAGPDVWN